jgi:large subunit ribosomal protein L24
LFAVGTPDGLNRSVDVTALSSWLAVRTIDHETRRLDAIERGERPPAFPASIPPPGTAPPSAVAPNAGRPDQPSSRAKITAPRPPAVPLPAPQPGDSPPVVSQQVAPLPPPIEVRPAPGPSIARPPRPKPPPPLLLTPQVATPPQTGF